MTKIESDYSYMMGGILMEGLEDPLSPFRDGRALQ